MYSSSHTSTICFWRNWSTFQKASHPPRMGLLNISRGGLTQLLIPSRWTSVHASVIRKELREKISRSRSVCTTTLRRFRNMNLRGLIRRTSWSASESGEWRTCYRDWNLNRFRRVALLPRPSITGTSGNLALIWRTQFHRKWLWHRRINSQKTSSFRQSQSR